MSNKYCFSLFLKVGTEGEFLISVDNLFHTLLSHMDTL